MILLEKKDPYEVTDIDVSPYASHEKFYADTSFNINSTGTVEIGKGTYINKNALIIAEHKVRIGRNCKISWDVIIMDTELSNSDHRTISHKPVVIEDNVSIGSNCIIQQEVTIGEGSIIAAGSVVNKDVPPYSIYSGCPARHIADLDQPKKSALKL